MSYDTWKAHEGNPWVNDETPPEDDGPPEFWEGRTGKWFITYDPPPIPTRSCDWRFVHEDYDGAPIEIGGPPADHRCGHAASWNECVKLIQEIEDDDEDADTWTDDDQQRYEYEMGLEANRRGDYWDEADLNEAEEMKDD